MDSKKISLILIIAAILIGLVAIWFALTATKKSPEKMAGDNNKPIPTKEVGFVVIRVLPSGFSPKEVTIQKGMIVRFTNPTETKSLLKWDGETQYTKALVYQGHDVATTVFEKDGTYAFSDEANHIGKVVVK